ncbi:MAG TPA: hypothetical protein VIA06_18995 [Candidatus Dormibacteraeota bacterium]|nr:hypothetical protein [Candidatus Dormibacteraeota bacterium]
MSESDHAVAGGRCVTSRRPGPVERIQELFRRAPSWTVPEMAPHGLHREVDLDRPAARHEDSRRRPPRGLG